MTECEHCQDQIVELLAEELSGTDARAVRDHLAECEACSEVEAKLRSASLFAAMMPVLDPPPEVAAAVMAAARVHCGDEAPAPAPSASVLPMPAAGFWGRLRVFAVRPQIAMATVMLLAVAFGAWYVPQQVDEGSASAGLRPEPGTSVEAEAMEADFPTAAAPGSAMEEASPLAEPGAQEGADWRARAEPRGPETPAAAVAAAAAGSTAIQADAIAAAESAAGERAQGVGDPRLERGLQAFGRSDYVAAIDELNAVVAAPNANESTLPTAMHHLARSYRENRDCGSASSRYEQLFRRFPNYDQLHLAMLEAGNCYRVLGNERRARELLSAASAHPATREAATAELELLGEEPRTRRPSRRSYAPAELPRPSPAARPAGYHDAPY